MSVQIGPRGTEVRHVLSVNDFDPDFIGELFGRVNYMKGVVQSREWFRVSNTLRECLLLSLFYEASSRTRVSFEAAAHRLGARVIASENAGEFSSRSKGESDLDALRVFAGYAPDAIVVRHDESDQLAAVAPFIDVPILNAGTSGDEHPTQALLDLFTILDEIGRVSGITVAMVGDAANGRTIRSLVRLLSKYAGNRFIFVTPDELRMKADILSELDPDQYEETQDLHYAMQAADVVYVTRIQAERGMTPESYRRVAGQFRVTPREMALLRCHAIVMHPLPRVQDGFIQRVKLATGTVKIPLVNELDPACDDHPRAAYFRQAHNGMPVRMALLEWAVKGWSA